MSKAHVDPVELRRFATDLGRFNQELQGLMGALHGRLRNLENSWKDQEQRKFTEAFEETARQLGQFLESSVEHQKILVKKASAIEEYLRQR
jgi:uncharacterized protein YukE